MTRDALPCSHLCNAEPGPLPFDAVLAIDTHGGITDAVIACRCCGETALLEMLDASGPALAVRVFRLSGIAREHAEAYGRARRAGSCDPGRGTRELEALLGCAGPVARIVACDLAGGRLLAARPPPADRRCPLGSWRDGLPAEEDDAWFRWLGLSKAR